MWSSKMAARWRGKDGDLNAGNGAFLTSNTLNELALRTRHVEGVDAQSCMDQSILAIFEDSTVHAEDKSGTEEESATLLTALTEMLDSVEDDDGTLSPFDTLPDTNLLKNPERRDDSVELSLVERLRSRSKSPDVPFGVKNGAEKEAEANVPLQRFTPQRQTSLHSKHKKADGDVAVFTSTSLVNLVRIMHSYCLKLHVEEDGDNPGRDHAFFSQEEVWKYERPSEESDEEINVVSDDEAAVADGKEAGDGDGEMGDGKTLKGVLLNGSSSRDPLYREKKRVSFGPVQVASFDESAEEGLTSGQTSGAVSVPPGGTKALENSAASAPEPSPEKSSNKAEILPVKGQAKAKSLSLQQYRQLRQKRRPLVERPGNYTTKWPSVPEPPKELTPILCLQGQRQNSCAPKTAHQYPEGQTQTGTSAPPRPHPSEARPSTSPCRGGPKRQRPESKAISPASKNSPVKMPALLSSDPPNPVLLPLADHSSSESLKRDSLLDSTRHFHDLQNESSGTSLQRQPCSPEPEVSSAHPDGAAPFQGIKTKITKITSGAASGSPAPIQPPSGLHAQQCSPSPAGGSRPEPKTPPSPSRVDAPLSKSPPGEPRPPPQPGPSVQRAAATSGIEASDLTSLLEQFEETQAKEERVEPTVEPLQTPRTSGAATTPQTLKSVPHLGVFVPEPLGKEVILSTQQDFPARRRNPPSKAIQIIDPRPLPPKKTHSHVEPAAPTPAHLYSSISSDHDYCGPLDRSVTSTTQRCRASKPGNGSKGTEMEATAQDSSAERKQQATSTCEVNAAAAAMSVTQHHPEEPRTGSETGPSTDKVLSDGGRAAGDRAAPCAPPTPPPSPPARGRDRRSEKYRKRSRSYSSSSSCSSSSSSSSSASRSPKRKTRRPKRSESSSCSSSPSGSPPRRYSWSYSKSRCSRSRSRSWSESRSPSRSRSPGQRICRRQWRDVCSSRESRRLRREHEIRIQKLKAIDERRVVYVGRICRSMTHDELRERFCQFGEVECVSLHFRERGDHYGFVTFYNTDDAFAAIDNGSKLRRADELPFDLCFGGRRQFCNSDYADLDANRDAELSPASSRFEDLDFDQLLKQAQRGVQL